MLCFDLNIIYENENIAVNLFFFKCSLYNSLNLDIT